MVSVCDPKQCTMCNACKTICPKNCISEMRQEHLWYMTKDVDKCINCHLCEKVCPNNQTVHMEESKKVYAAWSKDEIIRKTSASGGVAATLYNFAIDEGMYIAGVRMDDNFEAHYLVTNDKKYIPYFQNSKYTFSFTDSVHKEISSLLERGIDVLFIGLPCQVAAVKNYVGLKKRLGKLITIDIICHGTPDPEYLKDHIKFVENKTGKKARTVFFRDPVYKTDQFAFTVYSESILPQTNLLSKKSPTYIKYVGDKDMYQIGYHGGYIYRECCYQCHYAQKGRCGDLTIGDAHGLGKVEKYRGQKDNVSFLFVNTEQGVGFVKKMKGLLHMEERPLAEPYTYEPQLSHPSRSGKSVERKNLLATLGVGTDYEVAAENAFSNIAKRHKRNEILHIRMIKKYMNMLLPKFLKKTIKEVVKLKRG